MEVVILDSSTCVCYHCYYSNDAQVDYQEVECSIKGTPVVVITVIAAIVTGSLTQKSCARNLSSRKKNTNTSHFMHTNIYCHLVSIRALLNFCQFEWFKVLFHCCFVFYFLFSRLSMSIIFFRHVYISYILFHFIIHIH